MGYTPRHESLRPSRIQNKSARESEKTKNKVNAVLVNNCIIAKFAEKYNKTYTRAFKINETLIKLQKLQNNKNFTPLIINDSEINNNLQCKCTGYKLGVDSLLDSTMNE